MTTWTRPGTWTASGRRWAGPDQLLRVLVRHLPGPGLLDPVPVARPPADHGQQRGPPQGVVPGQPGPGHRVRPEHQDLVRLAGPAPRDLPPRPDREGGRNRFYAEKARLFKHPIQGMVGPDEWIDISCRPGTTGRPGSSWAARSRTGPTRRQKAGATIVSLYRVDRPATTTVSPSTTPCSAPTCSGRPAGRSGAGTTTGSTDRAVRDLGQRLVQRPVPALAGPARQPRCRSTVEGHQQCPADRRDPGCRDPVRGQPRGPPACSRAPCCWPSRAAPRTPTRSSATVRGQHRRRLPGHGQLPPGTRTRSGTRPASRCPAGPVGQQQQQLAAGGPGAHPRTERLLAPHRPRRASQP